MWIAIVVAAYWYNICPASMTLYLGYIFLYQGNRALHQHVYPQHLRRSVLSRKFLFMWSFHTPMHG